MPLIEVVLATCDSEPFLPALLGSLFAQTCQDFTILIADDASTDRTLEIVRAYSTHYPGRVRVVARHPRRLGIVGNFAALFDCASAGYVMPCDHDDVWLPEKVETTLARMRTLEAAHPAGTPLLVHTDVAVVGPQLELLGPSFFRFAGIDPNRSGIVDLLLSNVATGCATMVNRTLYTRARPIPPEAVMYDHWLALVAAATGAMSYMDRPTMLYRQHDRNSIGAKRASTISLIERVRQTLFSRERQALLSRYARQAAALLNRFGTDMPVGQRQAVEALAHIWSTRRWHRFGRLRRVGIGLGGLGLAGLLRAVALWIVVTRGEHRLSEPNQHA